MRCVRLRHRFGPFAVARAMLSGRAVHLLVSWVVVAFMFWCRSAGHREWCWGMAYNIPVNILFAIGYVVILCRRLSTPWGQANQRRRDDPSKDCSEPSLVV